MVCGRSVPVQALGFGLSRSACSSCGHREVNMSAVPEGITSADVIVWGEGARSHSRLRQHDASHHEFTPLAVWNSEDPHFTNCGMFVDDRFDLAGIIFSPPVTIMSVLRMVCWWRNTEALHLVKQGGALQTKSGSCTSWTSELPIGALASGENFSTHLVFKGGV